MKNQRKKVMDQATFLSWANRLQLSARAIAFTNRVRNSPPFRRTQGRFNVRGPYPSVKMGCGIQFESHRCELPAIIELEHDDDVIEFWDQPGSIVLRYRGKNGRNQGYSHVPDFLILRANSVGFLECKRAQEVKEKAEECPAMYVRESNGKWRCPPGEAFAAQLGMTYELYVADGRGGALTRNLTFLDDYYRTTSPLPSKALVSKVQALIREDQGVTYSDLVARVTNLGPDELNNLIAQGMVYTDLRKVLLVDPESVDLYTDRIAAESVQALKNSMRPVAASEEAPIELVPTARIRIGGQELQVINVTDKMVQLRSSEGVISHHGRCDIENLICEGRVSGIATEDSKQRQAQLMLNSSSPEVVADAVRKWKLIAPFIDSEGNKRNVKAPSNRSIRRWIADFRDAFSNLGYGFLGLLSKERSGNTKPRLDLAVEELMEEIIRKELTTTKDPLISSAYRKLCLRCEQAGFEAPSAKTFSKRVNSTPAYKRIGKQKGRRAAYQKRPFYFFLDQTTPVHGDRVWEIGHIDHTELDIELICKKTGQNLGRPWLSLMTDAYTRRVLAFRLSYFSESSESCMRVIRECVKRNGRLPQILVVDQGSSFESVYFEALVAFFGIIKKSRPSAHPRFGSVIERMFGTVNAQFIHNLWGNTKITKNVRQVTKSVDPKNHAVWTLEDLNEALSVYLLDVYDTAHHSTLGMSPRTAMLRSLKQCGARQHKYIPYSYTFQVLTMPTTRSGRAKVHPQKGVRVNYLDYWSDAFLDPEIEGKEVDVRFDPDDVSVAHVYVHGQWEPCISSHAVVFKGWSYRAIKLASEELRATRKGAAKKRAITSRQLADFMSKVSDHESMRMLQLRESAAIPIPDQSNGSETETEETSTPAPEEDSQETSTPDQEDCFPTSNE